LDTTSFAANFLEQAYPHRDRLTCAGIGAGSAVLAAYPGVRFVEIQPHASLPFADRSFDIVYSSAVVEHVGSTAQQRHFIHELCRVGKRVFVTTPNRLFPVEHHTALPLINYLPLPIFRRLLRSSRFRFWSDESILNPLFASQFRDLFPRPRRVRIKSYGLGLGPFRSNLIALCQ
jgi:hypothetical protein